MATAARRTQAVPEVSPDPSDTAVRCAQAIAALRARASAAIRAGMTRFGIPNDTALGVGMREIQSLARSLGRDHALADALWRSEVYEARMLACYVADPARLDAAQMDRWVAGIDNWAHGDTACFALFDRSPLAWRQVDRWATRREEFVKRSAFALLASLARHDRSTADAPFLHGLALIEAAADDERHFVKKAVNWALRSLGRRNAALQAAALTVARRLATAKAPAPRWIGKDALRELTSAAVVARLAAKAAKTAAAKPAAKAGRAGAATPRADANDSATAKPAATERHGSAKRAARPTATKTTRRSAGNAAAASRTTAADAPAANVAASTSATEPVAAKPVAARKGSAKTIVATTASSARPGTTKRAST